MLASSLPIQCLAEHCGLTHETEVGMSKRGKATAERLRAKFRPDVIFSSPVVGAKQRADTICSSSGGQDARKMVAVGHASSYEYKPFNIS